LCFGAVNRELDTADTLQVDAVVSQTDEQVVTTREQLYHYSMVELIYQFLSHTVDITSKKLIDKLVTKYILSHDERKKIKGYRKTDAKVKSLLMMLSYKSSATFESFLTTLSETGHQSVAVVVHQALDTVGQTGQNPLQYARCKSAWFIYQKQL